MDSAPSKENVGKPAEKLVLVVDDDPAIRAMMTMLLEQEGFRFAQVADGQKALEQVKALKPDLILLDMMLPGLGGYEILRELQAAGSGDIPIVVMTGRMMDQQTVNMIRQEPNIKEFLEKPVKLPALAAVLHRLLGTEPRHSPRRKPFGGL